MAGAATLIDFSPSADGVHALSATLLFADGGCVPDHVPEGHAVSSRRLIMDQDVCRKSFRWMRLDLKRGRERARERERERAR